MQLEARFFSQMCDVFSRLFFHQDDAAAMAQNLGLHIGKVELHPRAINTWASVIGMAEEKDKIIDLFAQALQRNKFNPELLQLNEKFLAGSVVVQSVWRAEYRAYTEGPVEVAIVFDPNEDDKKAFKQVKNHLAAYDDIKCFEWKEQLPFQVVLLMMSPDLIGSDEPFLKLAHQAQQDGARVVPILFRACEWQRISYLGGRVPLPMNETFISDPKAWPDKDQAFSTVAKGVAGLAARIRSTEIPN